jgi:flagellar assembly factor FliW
MESAVMVASQDLVAIAHPFGTIEVSRDALMTFPVGGLFGFEKLTTYALVPAARRGLWWLMSPTSPPTTFVLADPFVCFPDYALDLGELEKAQLQIEQPEDALALVMLTIPEGGAPITANLRAPIVFNVTRRLAAQVVSRDESHGLATAIDLSVYPRNDAGLDMT